MVLYSRETKEKLEAFLRMLSQVYLQLKYTFISILFLQVFDFTEEASFM
jgi:hypothetical protein